MSVELALDRRPVERDKALIRPAIAGHLLPEGEGVREPADTSPM
jgi:hypothetical protein